jgi:hypothetical protein
MAMAAIVKITATTTNSSMRENPATEWPVRLDPLIDLSRPILFWQKMAFPLDRIQICLGSNFQVIRRVLGS